jgi:hypothetical protein
MYTARQRPAGFANLLFSRGVVRVAGLIVLCESEDKTHENNVSYMFMCCRKDKFRREEDKTNRKP